MPENSQPTNPRPLVVRFGALGDMTILTVIIRRLSERFGTPVDILGSGGWTRPLFEGQPGVGDLFLVGSRRWPYWVSPSQWELTQALRARGPSPTWLCDQDNEKIKRVLKRAGWNSTHLCHYAEPNHVPGPHMCDAWQQFAFRNPEMLGGGDTPLPSLPQAHAELIVAPQRRASLNTWLVEHRLNDTPLILIQVGNKRTMRRGSRTRISNSKYWPEENWAKVLRGLRDLHPAHAILLMGVPLEAELNDEILQLANVPRVFNVAHDVPIARLIALSERAVGMVSVDTGPAHVAAAVGCSVVTLFGKSSPALYAPRGPNARVACLTGTDGGEQSMLGIAVDEVLSAWQSIQRAP
jgi:heptosyltransferase-2/heptosyltransferase-3